MNIYDQLKQLWRRIAGLEKSAVSFALLIPKIPKDYSETETDTGVKWVDGKDIYQKTIRHTILEGNINIIGSSLYDNIVCSHGYIDYGGTLFDKIVLNGDCYLSSQLYGRLGLNGDGNLVLQQTGFVDKTLYVTIYYTKPTPVPSVTKAAKKKASK